MLQTLAAGLLNEEIALVTTLGGQYSSVTIRASVWKEQLAVVKYLN